MFTSWQDHWQEYTQYFCIFQSEDAPDNKRKDKLPQYDPPNTIFICNIITLLFFDENQNFSWSLNRKKPVKVGDHKAIAGKKKVTKMAE